MVIVTDAGQVNNYIASGADSGFINPPSAIHLILSKAQLEQLNGIYQGSGGNMSGLFSNTLSGANNIPSESNIKETKFSSTLNFISSAFGLTKTELAQACGIQSRKTLYNWIDGINQPRKSTIERIFHLLLIAQTWKQSGYTNDNNLLRQPILDEISVFDLLKSDSFDKELILFAGSRLNLSYLELNTLEDPFV